MRKKEYRELKEKVKDRDLRFKINPIIGHLNAESWYKARNTDEKDSFLTTEELVKVTDQLMAVIKEEVNSERERILKILKKVDKQRWSDADHCSCLSHAIWKIDETYKGVEVVPER